MTSRTQEPQHAVCGADTAQLRIGQLKAPLLVNYSLYICVLPKPCCVCVCVCVCVCKVCMMHMHSVCMSPSMYAGGSCHIDDVHHRSAHSVCGDWTDLQ